MYINLSIPEVFLTLFPTLQLVIMKKVFSFILSKEGNRTLVFPKRDGKIITTKIFKTMKRSLTYLFTALLAVFMATPAVYAQNETLEEILQQHFEVKNQEKLNTVQTVTATGKVVLQGGALELPFTMKQKREDMVRIDAQLQGMNGVLMAYNGNTGWTLAPWSGSTEPQDLPADQLSNAKESADIDSPLYNYEEKGHQLELMGMDEVEGTPTYKLKLTKSNGDVNYYYMDSENYVPLKITSITTVQGNEVESEQYLSNYKPVNGIIMAHTIDNRYNGMSQMQIIIDEYKLNEEIADSYFDKPSDSTGDGQQ